MAKKSVTHGTRACYFHHGCRCARCREANAEYQRQRRRDKTPRKVDPALAREHLNNLKQQGGVGFRVAADAAGVNEQALCRIRAGKRTYIQRRTLERILNVDATAANAGSLINGAHTKHLIERLLEMGFTKKELARRLGSKSNRPHRWPQLQIGKAGTGMVRAMTAMKVEKFYNMITAGDDEEE